MKLTIKRAALAAIVLAGSLSLLPSVQAGTPVFAFTNRDLLLSFRKTGATGGSTSPNNIEVNIGQASRFYGATPGSTITLTPFAGNQLGTLFDSLNDTTWSVGGCVPTVGDTGTTNVPIDTLWVTAPRVDPTIAAAPWVRNGPSTQGSTASQVKTILDNAVFYSGTVAGSANNTITEVVVPAGGNHEYGHFMGPFGNYGNTFQGNVENTTGPTFTTDGLNSRSDLYELRPDGTGKQPAGKYLGYFELTPGGTATFVAATTAPPAPTLHITTSNSVSTISFATTVGATYKLYYTNVSGLTAPTTSWPSISTNITGDGTIRSFTDSASASNRVYRVQAH